MRAMGQKTIFTAIIGAALLFAACAPAAAPTPTTAPSKPAASPGQAGAAPTAPAAKPSDKPAMSQTLAQLIEGAKKETTLKGMWSATSFGGATGLNELVEGMNKKYGLNIKAQFTPGPNMQGMMERIAQEAAAGKPASSDVFLGNAQAILDALTLGTQVLKPMDWASILERRFPSDAGFDPIAPNGIAVAFASTLVGITYNTDVVKGNDIPRRMEDVLDPKWRGRIASTPYAAGMREFAAEDMLGYERVKDFTIKLSNQIGGLIRCGEGDRLTSREFVMLVFDCGNNDVVVAQRAGAPLGHTLIEEATTLHLRYAGVPVNSASPNAAALLIAFLHTPEGQALLWKYDGMDFHLYPEANSREYLTKAAAPGRKVSVNTPQRLASLKDYQKIQKEFEDILRR